MTYVEHMADGSVRPRKLKMDEDAELAKEPDPCQHVVMPVRFVDEEPKPCPCRSHDCEVDCDKEAK